MEITKQDLYDIYDKLAHIKTLLTSSTCKCDVLKLSKCSNCDKIICDECDLVKCEICFKKGNFKCWMCCNSCAIYKKKDNGIYWYSCIDCKDIDYESIY